MEHIEAIGRLETDSKDRPLNKVIISHCGELELRRPPPARRPTTPLSAKSDTDSEEEERRERRRRKASKRDKRETSEERRERRSLKKEKRKSKKDGNGNGNGEETIDELDARLEREEKERLDAVRLEKEEAAKKERERLKAEGGVVYKGLSTFYFYNTQSCSYSRTRGNEICRSRNNQRSPHANQFRCETNLLPSEPVSKPSKTTTSISTSRREMAKRIRSTTRFPKTKAESGQGFG